MAFPFRRKRADETRAAVHDPQTVEPAPQGEARARIGEMATQSDPMLVQFFGMPGAGGSQVVTIDSALQVPAVWAAVNFLARTLASLPIKVFLKTDGGRQAQPDDPLAAILNDAPNDELNAYAWRFGFWQDVFTAGRSVSFIERNGAGQVINIWPLEIGKVRVERKAGRLLYHYRDGSRPVTYAASEVLDIAFMPGGDRLSARSPIYFHADTIGLALAITKYGARVFDNGGVPPFVITGPFNSPAAGERAAADVTRAVAEGAKNSRNALGLPAGHEIKTLGIDPEKLQMIDVQRFVIEQVARIYGMPPAFLQDLTHGTFSNVEQQDLQLVKHVAAPWSIAFEKEAKLKLYGRAERKRYAEKNLDGLARGDLKTRSEAIAAQINTGQLTPNESRALHNRPALPGGDSLLVQGAMVPAERLQQKGEPDE